MSVSSEDRACLRGDSGREARWGRGGQRDAIFDTFSRLIREEMRDHINMLTHR